MVHEYNQFNGEFGPSILGVTLTSRPRQLRLKECLCLLFEQIIFDQFSTGRCKQQLSFSFGNPSIPMEKICQTKGWDDHHHAKAERLVEDFNIEWFRRRRRRKIQTFFAAMLTEYSHILFDCTYVDNFDCVQLYLVNYKRYQTLKSKTKLEVC